MSVTFLKERVESHFFMRFNSELIFNSEHLFKCKREHITRLSVTFWKEEIECNEVTISEYKRYSELNLFEIQVTISEYKRYIIFLDLNGNWD